MKHLSSNNSNNRQLTISGLLTVATLSCFALSAQANDGKVYSAAGCIADESYKNVITHNSKGHLFNTSANRNAFILCPIVKDTMRSQQNVNSHIWVKNRGDRSLFCTHVSKTSYPQSQIHVSYFTTRSTNQSSYWRKLQFGITNANAYGPQYIYCLVPSVDAGKISYVGNYYIEEKD